jgi:hypothetical protein
LNVELRSDTKKKKLNMRKSWQSVSAKVKRVEKNLAENHQKHQSRK